MSKKFRLKIISILMLLGGFYWPVGAVDAVNCPPLKIIFVRGSGAPLNTSSDYLDFKSNLEERLNLVDLEYQFVDLDYPAVGVDNVGTATGAYFGAGDSYEFGESVSDGKNKLIRMVNDSCPDTKYVLAGYSQGAMVISGALSSLNANKIIYAATFGDPKIYLPEGKGIMPAACKNQNLSNYRIYVPDCYAYEGLLGSYRPYQPEVYVDKLGTWCNKSDIFCSSYYSINSHTSYVRDKLYADASKLIFAKVTKAFGIRNDYVSEHDTAILIDSTGSMAGLIEKYKAEALRLAKKTFDAGGRVALYDYRDLNDPYQPVEHCNFTTCTLEVVERELDSIEVGGGGDTAESLLSSSYTMMQKLEWKYGATKSVVVLTDAGYHSPDIDGKTFADVVNMSKSIDPVNFYIITTPELVDYYDTLANATGGMAVITADDLTYLTDYIMERYDSLPRVEESEDGGELPEIVITNIDDSFGDTVTVDFNNSGTSALVILNDYVLGVTGENSVIVSGLDRNVTNTLRLVPLSETRRGEAVEINFGNSLVPKAPDTGQI